MLSLSLHYFHSVMLCPQPLHALLTSFSLLPLISFTFTTTTLSLFSSFWHLFACFPFFVLVKSASWRRYLPRCHQTSLHLSCLSLFFLSLPLFLDSLCFLGFFFLYSIYLSIAFNPYLFHPIPSFLTFNFVQTFRLSNLPSSFSSCHLASLLSFISFDSCHPPLSPSILFSYAFLPFLAPFAPCFIVSFLPFCFHLHHPYFSHLSFHFPSISFPFLLVFSFLFHYSLLFLYLFHLLPLSPFN